MKSLKFDYVFFFIILLILFLLAAAARAQDGLGAVSSGGSFILEKSVIAGGGGSQMSQSPLSLGGTSGQSVSGHKSTGGSFSIYSGFWTPESFAPTAANVVAGGQVKTAGNRGIQNALVTVTFANGEIRTTKTTSFGYYRFSDIPAGGTYIFTVASKRFRFVETTLIRTILDDAADIDFIASDRTE